MKTILPRLLNYILYAVGILLAGSGLLLKWKIPHGQAGRDVSLWGLDKHDLKDFHLWGGIIIALLVGWHLWLHRKWIMNVACQKRSVWLLGGLLAPVILVGALALTPLGQAPHTGGECSSNNCGQCKDKKTGATRNPQSIHRLAMAKVNPQTAVDLGSAAMLLNARHPRIAKLRYLSISSIKRQTFSAASCSVRINSSCKPFEVCVTAFSPPDTSRCTRTEPVFPFFPSDFPP